MWSFKQYINMKRILKKVQPLTFVNDTGNVLNNTQYLINWLKNIGIEATDISDSNRHSSVLAVNIRGKGSTYNMYCISIALHKGTYLGEDVLAELKAEADKYGAIPVLIIEKNMDDSFGIIAKTLGIQLLVNSQLDGFNYLLVTGKLPKSNIENTMFISKLAYYTHMKLT